MLEYLHAAHSRGMGGGSWGTGKLYVSEEESIGNTIEWVINHFGSVEGASFGNDDDGDSNDGGSSR